MRRRTKLAFLCLVAEATACGVVGRGPSAAPVPTAVEVDNREFADVQIFVNSSSGHISLGVVPGLSARTLVIPPAALGDGYVQVSAQPRQGPALQSPRLQVGPGQIISWRVERASHGALVMVRHR